LTTGAHSNNAYELLDIQRVEQLFEELKHRYDVILIDSPPLLDVTDAKLLASRSDGVILVVKARSTKGAQVRKAKECLENVGARILGAVINDKKE
jgi:receptor protein-tyrosine kinase